MALNSEQSQQQKNHFKTQLSTYANGYERIVYYQTLQQEMVTAVYIIHEEKIKI